MNDLNHKVRGIKVTHLLMQLTRHIYFWHSAIPPSFLVDVDDIDDNDDRVIDPENKTEMLS